VSKETYYRAKRDLVEKEKRPSENIEAIHQPVAAPASPVIGLF
jgi:hypothetical protein